MRLYSKKIIKKQIKRQTDQRTESRDAILWDILSDQRLCRVKIQGSNELIIANYPLNRKIEAEFMKPGNAVRVAYVDGQRGRLEIVGHGRNLPTPVEGPLLPPEKAGEDLVLTGCKVVAFDPPVMAVNVTSGTYRIAGAVYAFGSGYVLPETGGFHLSENSGPILDDQYYIVEIDSPPSTTGYFRYDAISIGTDGVPLYTKGTESKWPEIPSIPNQHVLLGTVLLYEGQTVIRSSDLNRERVEPKPFFLKAECEIGLVEYEDENEYTMTVSVLDQYEHPIYLPDPGWKITLSELSGTGTYDPPLFPPANSWTENQIRSGSQRTGENSNSVSWKYKRSSSLFTEEHSVLLRFTLQQEPDLEGYVYIALQGETGAFEPFETLNTL